MKKISLFAFSMIFAGFLATSCNNANSSNDDKAGDKVEQMGDQMDNAADDAGDAMDNAADKAGDAMDNAADSVDNAMDNNDNQ